MADDRIRSVKERTHKVLASGMSLAWLEGAAEIEVLVAKDVSFTIDRDRLELFTEASIRILKEINDAEKRAKK